MSGKLGALEGAERWTSSAADDLGIKDMGTDDDLDAEDDMAAVAAGGVSAGALNVGAQAGAIFVAALHLGGGDHDDDDGPAMADADD